MDDVDYWRRLRKMATLNNGLIRTFEVGYQTEHIDSLTQVAWCLDESRVASASHDGTVKVSERETPL